MSFWIGTLTGLLIGAPLGAVLAYFWPRHRQPLGTADAPVDKLVRRIPQHIRRLRAQHGTLRILLLGMVGAFLVTMLVTITVLALDWNKAKDATEKADRALQCQQFNDRESTRAQIRAAEANIELRNNEISFLTAQREFLTPLSPGLPRDVQEIEERFAAYLASLSEAIVSLEKANGTGYKLIAELKQRDIECSRDATGIGR